MFAIIYTFICLFTLTRISLALLVVITEAPGPIMATRKMALLFCNGCQVMQINSLWPIDIIWWHGFLSTLAQVMVWCHQAANHNLSHCWLKFFQWMFVSCYLGKLHQEVLFSRFLWNLPGDSELSIINNCHDNLNTCRTLLDWFG